MHDSLISYINSQLVHKLSENEEHAIRKSFVYKKLRKHQYFLQEGDVCKFAGFVLKGALKQYTIDETGKEDILSLFLENWWVSDRQSFMNETYSPFYIDAFETTELLVITKDSYIKYLKEQPFITELANTLLEKQALLLLKRVHTTKTYTAEQRLADLEKNYPEFLQRFPQHIIASFLGMTKETLSRIRANSLKK